MEVNSQMTNLKKKTASTDEKRRAYAISGTYKEVDAPKVKAILTLLQKISGDASLEMVDIEEGSIRLILEGSTEGLEQLEALFKSGELTEVEGIPVEDVSFVAGDTSDSGVDIKISGKKRLAFTIAGSVDSADIAKLKAEITQPLGDDERTESEVIESTGKPLSKEEEAMIAEYYRLLAERIASRIFPEEEAMIAEKSRIEKLLLAERIASRILPEELVAELLILRQRMKYQLRSFWFIQLRMLLVIVEMLLGFYISILQNTVPRRKRR